MVKKRRFKDVHAVYYLPKKGLCDVYMKGTKPTSKERSVTDIPCKGFSVTVDGALVHAEDYSSYIFFHNRTVCEFNPKWKKIMCPP